MDADTTVVDPEDGKASFPEPGPRDSEAHAGGLAGGDPQRVELAAAPGSADLKMSMGNLRTGEFTTYTSADTVVVNPIFASPARWTLTLSSTKLGWVLTPGSDAAMPLPTSSPSLLFGARSLPLRDEEFHGTYLPASPPSRARAKEP